MSLSKKCRFPECCLVRAAGIIETLLSRCWRRWAPQLIWTLVPCEAPILALLQLRWGFLGSTSHKEHTCQCRRHKRREFNPRIGKIPWRKAWQPTLVFLPGECKCSFVILQLHHLPFPSTHIKSQTQQLDVQLFRLHKYSLIITIHHLLTQ